MQDYIKDSSFDKRQYHDWIEFKLCLVQALKCSMRLCYPMVEEPYSTAFVYLHSVFL